MIRMVVDHLMPAAMSVMPPAFDTPNARALMLAIGLQESDFQHRQQREFGPARGFWQFEKGGGVYDVMHHRAARPHLDVALRALHYDHIIGQDPKLHTAIEHNDVLACVCARLLLRTIPAPLPERDEVEIAWQQYLKAWRPGEPRPFGWPDRFAEAWALVAGDGRLT